MAAVPQGSVPEAGSAERTAGTEGDIVVRYRGRAVSFVPFGGRIEARLRRNRYYESSLLEYIASLQLPGTYVDVGGFVGTHALFFATYCPADVVHSIEPRPDCYDNLRRNIDANGLADLIRAHRLGVSDRAETVNTRIGRRRAEFRCVRLDELVKTRVSVLKIDVEGMEAKVLAGASGILRADKPVIFVEAHGPDEVARNLAVVRPYGYVATGRVFNSSPTYELAAADSPTAGRERLPRPHPLGDPDRWVPSHPAVDVSSTGAGRLSIRSRLPEEATADLTQRPLDVDVPPASRLAEIREGSCYYVQATGERDDSLRVSLAAIEYGAAGRATTHELGFHPRMLTWREPQPGTTAVRLVMRLAGSGELRLETVALHVLDAAGTGKATSTETGTRDARPSVAVLQRVARAGRRTATRIIRSVRRG